MGRVSLDALDEEAVGRLVAQWGRDFDVLLTPTMATTPPLVGTVLVFGAGNIFFPISYIFGDILTEVYGYGRDRRVVWAGFAALAFASFMAWVALSLPPKLASAMSD